MNLVLNGNFELGNWDNWYVHYATVSKHINFVTGKEKRVLDYTQTSADQPSPEIVDITSQLPQQGLVITPFEGSRMLRINDLEGGHHVTCAHQTITLPDDFDDSCAYISFSWGALLGGSGHDEKSRPRFSFDINVKRNLRWTGFLNVEYFAPSGGGDGWSDVRAAGEEQAVWFKSGVEKKSLYGLKGGDIMRIRFIAEDCTDGGHGGAGFIDNVIISNGCASGSAIATPIPEIVVPNVFTPNGDGVNDIWGLNNVTGACLIKLKIFDRWGDLVYVNNVQNFDGAWDPFVGLWNGLIRTRRRAKGFGKRKKYYWRKIRAKDMTNSTVFYVLSLKNCSDTKEYTGFISIFL